MSYRLTEAEGKHISTVEDFQISFERISGSVDSLPRTIVHLSDGGLLDISGELPRYKFQVDGADDKVSKLHLIDELTGYEVSTAGYNDQGLGWRYRISGIFEQGSRGDPDKKYLTSLKLIRINDGKEFRVRLDTFGATNFKSIDVDGNAELKGDVLLSGILTSMSDASFEQDVNISGILTQQDNAFFNKNVEIDGDLRVDGNTVLGDQAVALKGLWVSGLLNVRDKTEFHNNVDITNGKLVAEDASFSKKVVASDGIEVTGGLKTDSIELQYANVSGAVVSGLEVVNAQIQNEEVQNSKVENLNAENAVISGATIKELEVINAANIESVNTKSIRVTNGAQISGLAVASGADIDSANIGTGNVVDLSVTRSATISGVSRFTGTNEFNGNNTLNGNTNIKNVKIISGNVDDVVIARETVTNSSIQSARISEAEVIKETVGNSYVTQNLNVSGVAEIENLTVKEDGTIEGDLSVKGNAVVEGKLFLQSIVTDDIKDTNGNNLINSDGKKVKVGSTAEQIEIRTDFNKSADPEDPEYYRIKARIGDRDTYLVTQEDIQDLTGLNPSGIVDRVSNQTINGQKTFLRSIVAQSGIYTMDLEPLPTKPGDPLTSGLVPHNLVTREVDPNEDISQAWIPNEPPRNLNPDVSYSGISGKAFAYEELLPKYNSIRKDTHLIQDAYDRFERMSGLAYEASGELDKRIQNTAAQKASFDAVSGELYVSPNYAAVLQEAQDFYDEAVATLSGTISGDLFNANEKVKHISGEVLVAEVNVNDAYANVSGASGIVYNYEQQTVAQKLVVDTELQKYNNFLTIQNEKRDDLAVAVSGLTKAQTKVSQLEYTLSQEYANSGLIVTQLTANASGILFASGELSAAQTVEALKQQAYDNQSGVLANVGKDEADAQKLKDDAYTTYVSARDAFLIAKTSYNDTYSVVEGAQGRLGFPYPEYDPDKEPWLDASGNPIPFAVYRNDVNPPGVYTAVAIQQAYNNVKYLDQVQQTAYNHYLDLLEDYNEVLAEVSDETAKLVTAENELKQAQADVLLKQTILTGLQQEKTRLESMLATSLTQIQTDEALLATAKQEVETAQDAVNAAQAAYSTAVQNTDTQLEILNEARATLASLDIQLQDAQTELNTALDNLKKAQDRLAVIKEELNEANAELDAVYAQIQHEEADIASKKAALDYAQNEFNIRFADMKRYEDAYNTAVSEQTTAQNDYDDKVSNRKTADVMYKSLFDGLKAEFDSYVIEYTAYYTSYNSYKSELLEDPKDFGTITPYNVPENFFDFMIPLNEPFMYKEFVVGLVNQLILDPDFDRIVLVGNDYDELKLRSAPMGNGDKHIQATFDGQNKVIANADDIIHLDFAEGTDDKLIGDIEVTSGVNSFELTMKKNTIVSGYSGMAIPDEPVVPPVKSEKLFGLISANNSIAISGVGDNEFSLEIHGGIQNGVILDADISGYTSSGIQFTTENTVSGRSKDVKIIGESRDLDIDVQQVSGEITVTQKLKNILTQPDDGRNAIDFNGDITKQYLEKYEAVQFTQTEYEKRMLASAMDLKVLTEYEENERKQDVAKLNRRLPEAPVTATGRFNLVADVRVDPTANAKTATYAWAANTSLPDAVDENGDPLEFYTDADIALDPTKTNEYGPKLKVLPTYQKDQFGNDVLINGKKVHETQIIWAKLI
jgi:hypothetical protein